MILAAMMAAALAAPPRQYTEAEINALQRVEWRILVGFRSYGLSVNGLAIMRAENVRMDMALGLTADDLVRAACGTNLDGKPRDPEAVATCRAHLTD